MIADDAPTPAHATTRIWDFPVRLFHWLIVALLGFSWWSGERHEMEWHRTSGYGVLGLLIFRVYWGLAGSRTARFTHFVRGPRVVLGYLPSLLKRPYAPAPGHNPIGGWSVVAMLATLVVMVVAGLFAVDVDGLESGPLADYVSFDQGRWAAGVHHLMFNVLLALVALHVAAVLFYLLLLRTNLVGPMVTGHRRGGDGVPLPGSPWKAAIGLALAVAVAYAVSRGFHFR